MEIVNQFEYSFPVIPAKRVIADAMQERAMLYIDRPCAPGPGTGNHQENDSRPKSLLDFCTTGFPYNVVF